MAEDIKIPDHLILFDGVCNLCNASVTKTIEKDKKNLFYFSSLQSELGQKLRSKFNLENIDSFVYINKGEVYIKSSAALRVAKQLSGLYPILFAFIIVPPFIRNVVYDFIAHNRYKWFGRTEECMIPTLELRKKFL